MRLSERRLRIFYLEIAGRLARPTAAFLRRNDALPYSLVTN
jgi:hypothetical protein